MELSQKSADWSRLWQVPLALLGLLIFGLGLRFLVQHFKRVPFETHVADVQSLINAHQYQAAIDHINDLAKTFIQPKQAAQLELLAADTYWQAQPDPPQESNYQHTIEHYEKALKLGTAQTPEMDERWGEASLALGDTQAAIEHLERAGTGDPTQLPAHCQFLVNAYLHSPHPKVAQALELLDQVLALKTLTLDQRVWALCREIELSLGQPQLEKPLADARQALAGIKERDPAGRLLLWIGRGEFEQGDLTAAKRDLQNARSQFTSHHLDDGRAALLLGKIAQAQGQIEAAEALFQEVVESHQGTVLWPAARLGIAETLAARNEVNPTALDNYRFAIKVAMNPAINSAGKALPGAAPPEFFYLAGVRASLDSQFQRCTVSGQTAAALTYLSMERSLNDPETPQATYDWASTQERRGDELLADSRAAAVGSVQRADWYQQALEHYAVAAAAYNRHAKLNAVRNVKIWSDSQWKAAQLYDKAGQTEASIAVYRDFARDHPGESRVPEALYNMGVAEQSLGQYAEAIENFQRNIAENSKTPAGYMSSVGMGRCFMAQGAEKYPDAEKALLGLVQDNKDILPTAAEFRAGLFALGELYYRWGRWPDAILRLEEVEERYPNDLEIPQATFWLAESYRKSARELAAVEKKGTKPELHDRLEEARKNRLGQARDYYSRVIAELENGPAVNQQSLSLVEAEYLRESYLGRADCGYDLGEYASALTLYGEAADKFSDSIAAVEASVQIVNCHLAMNEAGKAAAAAERARWVLGRIPDEAFGKPPLELTRGYYEDFLKLAER